VREVTQYWPSGKRNSFNVLKPPMAVGAGQISHRQQKARAVSPGLFESDAD